VLWFPIVIQKIAWVLNVSSDLDDKYRVAIEIIAVV
jgi:hypothetical protein